MDLVLQLIALTCGSASGCPAVVMVQPTQDRTSYHLVPCILSGRTQAALFRDLLPNALMGSCLVEVGHIRIEHALELLLLKDQQVVQTFLPHTPQEALADGIGSGSVIRSFENLDATRRRHTSKARSEFAIVIPNQVLWRLSIGCGFSQLLRHLGIGRRSRDAHVDHLARFQFDEKEGKERPKEQIGDLQEITGPDLSCMAAQKGRPLLTS